MRPLYLNGGMTKLMDKYLDRKMYILNILFKDLIHDIEYTFSLSLGNLKFIFRFIK